MRIERQNTYSAALTAQQTAQTLPAQNVQTAQEAEKEQDTSNRVQDGFVRSSKSESVTYQPPKKLTEDQVQELKKSNAPKHGRTGQDHARRAG